MQEQLVYLIGNAFRIYIYFKLLNTMFGTAKVKQIWIIIGFTFYFLMIDCQVKCNTIREKNFEAPRRESEN